MSCTIIVGGQYGSEGKGKVTALEACAARSPWVIRCGGPNSGHTIGVSGRDVVLRQLPAGVANPSARLLIGAGCVVDVDVLLREVRELRIERDRLFIDPRAVLVSPGDREAETRIVESIGSTGSGTGAALVRRMLRRGDVQLAGDSAELAEVGQVRNVARLLHEQLQMGAEVLIEGTQGFQLSLLHGARYPFVTSRDTTASAFLSEVGLSPRVVDRVVMVVRTFPIRVGGNSGPFTDEITWEMVQQLSGAPTAFPEFTSVTKKLRRVARFDLAAVKTAADYNQPTELALMGLDRLDFNNEGILDPGRLSRRGHDFLQQLESAVGVPVSWVGTGFRCDQAFALNRDRSKPVKDSRPEGPK